MVAINRQNINKWLKNGSLLGAEQMAALKEFTKEYPYYGPTQALLAKAYYNTNEGDFEAQLRKAALTTSDRVWLYDFIHSTVNESKEVEEKGKAREKQTQTPKVQSKKKDKASVKSTAEREKKTKARPKKKSEISKAEPAINKIILNPGEGKVTTHSSKKEDDIIQAKAPKLVIDESPQELNPIENRVPTISTESPKDNSFLDWLDYTNLNPIERNEVPIVKLTEISTTPEVDTKEEIKSGSENNVDKTVDLLEKFIANKPKPGEIKLESYDPEEKSEASDSADTIPVSETLAQVYIGQNEQEMAKEVYRKLILKFPEKRAYFADLIQKLNKE